MGNSDLISSTTAMNEQQQSHNHDKNIVDAVTEATTIDDPLQQKNEIEGQPAAVALSTMSREDMIKMLSERHVLQLTPEEDELLDPIERSIRYIIPIPKYYYWDILKESQMKDDNDDDNNNSEAAATNKKNSITSDQIPYSIKSWHTMIGLCDSIGTYMNKNLAQPIASYIGLTGPRFHEVINSMSDKELQQSQRIIQQRQLRDQLHQQV